MQGSRRVTARQVLLVLAGLSIGSGGAASAAGPQRWPDERQAGPFFCHADFPLSTYQPLLEELGQLQSDLAALLGTTAPRQPIHLFLFQSRTTYQAYVRHYFPQVPPRRALFIQVRGPGMVFACQGPQLAEDVRHECTHALLHAWLPQVPLWLDEGLAEYFEVPRSQRLRGNPHHAAVLQLLAGGRPPRLEPLETLTRVEQMGREAYRDAWAWVHFLLHGPPEAQQELLRYLGDLARDAAPPPLAPRLRRHWPEPERRLAEHFASLAPDTAAPQGPAN